MDGNGVRRVVVIMAGGSGERFWPLSRKKYPKQLLKLASSDVTLLEEAVDRGRLLAEDDAIFVATGRHLQKAIREAKLGIPDENVIGEPEKRNTLGCLVYMAAQIRARWDEDAAMAVLTADHRIGEKERFSKVVDAALDAALKEKALVTIGVRPTRVATEFGYLEKAEGAEPVGGSSSEAPVYPVVRFVEKPDEETARKYFDSGRFLWNSGMFFWSVSTFMRELRAAKPEVASLTERLTEALKAGDQEAADKVFLEIKGESIDYALMEKAERVLVAEGDFPWDDLGSWDSLDRTFEGDENGNVAIGDPVLLDVKDSIIYNSQGSDKMAVSVIGLEGIVVVTCEDGVLVASKERSQDVKKAVAELKSRNASQL